jgi:hypothetical protein
MTGGSTGLGSHVSSLVARTQSGKRGSAKRDRGADRHEKNLAPSLREVKAGLRRAD